MKGLLIYLKDYRKESILGPLFKLLEASFELFVPLVIAAIIDTGIKNADKPFVIRMSLILITLGIVGFISSATAQFFAAKAAVGFVKNLKNAVFAHVHSLSFSDIDNLGTSNIITGLTNDMNQILNGVNLFLRLALRSPFVVFGAMFMAMTIDLKSTLIFGLAILLLTLVVFFIMYFSLPVYKKIQTKLDGILGLLKENLAGVRVIRAFRLEDREKDDFEAKNRAMFGMQQNVVKLASLMNPATYVIANFAILFLIYKGAVRVNQGSLSQGEVVALYSLMTQISVELIKTARLVITITRSIASARRVSDILDTQSSQSFEQDIIGTSENKIRVEFKNVSLSYGSSSEKALTNISFTAKAGETVGLIGGTGAGKSSLVHLIPRFYDPSEGQVLINRIDAKAYPKDELRKKVAIVMQRAVLFSGTVRENISWGKANASDDEIFKALETAQIKDYILSKGGLDFEIEEGGTNLSGGQRQRLSIARALVRQAEILILDDSSSALDFATDAGLRKAIRENYKDTTVFIVSQRTSSVWHASKIITLDKGEIVGMGTHEDLLENSKIYKEIYDSQF